MDEPDDCDGGGAFFELATGLPAQQIIRKGIDDLGNNVESIESLLVQIGWPRLKFLGAPIKQSWRDIDADRRLYSRLYLSDGHEAHSQYKSLLRQLSSFARAFEHQQSARERAQHDHQ
jgi:hypothetical protein